MRHIKALPIEGKIGTLHSSMSDTAGGKKITAGGTVMGSHAGTCKVTHKGSEYTIDIIHDMGASIAMTHKGRTYRLNLQAFLDEAIEAGLLNPTPMDFPVDTKE